MAPLPRVLLLQALLAAALVLPVSARVERAAVVYAAPNSAWAASVSAPLENFRSNPGLSLGQIARLEGAAQTRSLAPVIYELTRSLKFSPESFAALSDREKQTALELAAEAAGEDIAVKAHELVVEAQSSAREKPALTKPALDELYGLAARLREINLYYAPFLDDKQRGAVGHSAAQSAARWRQARAAYVALFGEAGAQALQEGRQPQARSTVLGAAAPAFPLTASVPARKLLKRMKETKSGWGEKDLETVYLGYGFTFRDGAKHRVYSHPRFPQLHDAVSRQRDLPPGYAATALKLIAELEALSAPQSLAAAALEEELPPPIAEIASAQPAPSDAKRVKPLRAEPRRISAAAPLQPAVAGEPTSILTRTAPAVDLAPARVPAPARTTAPVKPPSTIAAFLRRLLGQAGASAGAATPNP